jgi:pyruvate, water dikinase
VELTAMTTNEKTTNERYTLAFDSPMVASHDRLGGKCTSLAIMTAAGMPVPPGFTITTDAFERTMEGTSLRRAIADTLDGLNVDDTDDVDARAARCRDLILTQAVPEEVRDEVLLAYRALMERCQGEVAVAVRSSATAEDLPDASFAGQQDTYLWVVGERATLQAVRECWASLYTARAITYRAANGIPDAGLSMAVAIQKMVNSRSSGVAMTVDPSNGDRSKIVVESSWGIGELVVSGEVTPDNFLLDKIMLSVISTTIGDKHEELVPTGTGSIVRRAVDPDRRSAPSLSDDELMAVARLTKAAEKHYGTPQDVEWAIDADLPAGDNVLLLQSRPETVWSRRAAPTSVASPGAGVEAIAKSMLAGLNLG